MSFQLTQVCSTLQTGVKRYNDLHDEVTLLLCELISKDPCCIVAAYDHHETIWTPQSWWSFVFRHIMPNICICQDMNSL